MNIGHKAVPLHIQDMRADLASLDGGITCHRRAPNLLLIGPDAATREYLDRLVASWPSPIRLCDSAEPFLPTEPVHGLVVRDVERLKRHHQDELIEWLDGAGHATPVISTSGRSLFPLVQQGDFSDTLYYRLNMVTLKLDRAPIRTDNPR
jgi:Sigma-54 interaction domain